MSIFAACWLEVEKLLASRISHYGSQSAMSVSVLKVSFLCFMFCYLSPGSLKRRHVQCLRHKDLSSLRLQPQVMGSE